jgi:trehalose 6-phosphate synthase
VVKFGNRRRVPPLVEPLSSARSRILATTYLPQHLLKRAARSVLDIRQSATNTLGFTPPQFVVLEETRGNSLSMHSTNLPSVDSEPSLDNANLQGTHLIVVSNRLPITITKDSSGEYHFKMSSGGLVSALSGFKKYLNFTWIGWPGFFIPPKDRPLVDKRLMEEYSCQAVYLDDDVADRHYNGFSNSILWPLFHYHPGEMNFDEENWLAYRQANMKFAKAVRQQITPGAMVWVQDYHLMLLPMLLRGLIDDAHAEPGIASEELSKITEGVEGDNTSAGPIKGIKIGFFLHTPFPSSEIYRFVSFNFSLSCCLTSESGFFPSDGRFCLGSCTVILLASIPTTMLAISSRRARAFLGYRLCRTELNLQVG